MGILKKAIDYERIVKELMALRPGQEEIILIEGHAFVVKLAEVADVERVGGKVYEVWD